jgi:uncharacterized RDD family membrane protein YckC
VAEVVTGEAVVLDVPCARFPSRIAALLIDLLIQFVLLIALLTAAFMSAGHVDAAAGAGIALTCYVAIVVGYSAIFETLTRGKTPGKMAFGLRVISDDGGPVRFRQALVRAMMGAIEIWSLIGAPIGLITSLVSEKGKRLGDMFAGTYVIQERAPHRPDLPPMFAVVPPPLMGWAQAAEISRLTDQTAEAAGSYLRRFHELTDAARHDLGLRIATAMVAQVSPPPPPGTPPWAYLAAVLAIRRQRDKARLASPRPWPADGAAGEPPGPWPAHGATGPPPGPWTAPAAPPPAAGTWTSPGARPAAGGAPWPPGDGTGDLPVAAAAPNPDGRADADSGRDHPAQGQTAQGQTAQGQTAQGQPAQGPPGHGGFAPPA